MRQHVPEKAAMHLARLVCDSKSAPEVLATGNAIVLDHIAQSIDEL